MGLLHPDRGHSRRQGYARYWCARCPESAQVWREGGHAALDKHSFVYHPGAVVDGDVKTFESPAPAAHSYGETGGKK